MPRAYSCFKGVHKVYVNIFYEEGEGLCIQSDLSLNPGPASSRLGAFSKSHHLSEPVVSSNAKRGELDPSKDEKYYMRAPTTPSDSQRC